PLGRRLRLRSGLRRLRRQPRLDVRSVSRRLGHGQSVATGRDALDGLMAQMSFADTIPLDRVAGERPAAAPPAASSPAAPPAPPPASDPDPATPAAPHDQAVTPTAAPSPADPPSATSL